MDWGLGHATRCVPLIKQLMIDNTVIIGVSGTTTCIFEDEFPQLLKIKIEPYCISYSKFIPVVFKLILDAPRILKVIKKEHHQLKKIIQDYKVDVVISDNRFGLYNSNVETVYITHQLSIKAGLFSFLANLIHHRFIKNFNQIWVPDVEDFSQSLAGDLSRSKKFTNVHYVGFLSRLNHSINKTENYDILILLSGVEPQRSILETKLIEYFKGSEKKICIIRGTSKKLIALLPPNCTVFDLPNANVLSNVIQNSEIIICRSGYSTLMDLCMFQKKKLILIPTPGQTEQYYLANYWKRKFGVKVVLQRNIKSLEVS